MKVVFIHVLINQKTKAHSPPLGILFLISMLRSEGVECELVQFSHLAGTPLDPGDLAQVLQVEADVVGVGCMINALPLLMMALAEVAMTSRLLLGGPGFQGIGDALLPAIPQASAIAVGEFEQSIGAACQSLCGLLPPDAAPNLIIRTANGVQKTRAGRRITDLDAIPRAAYGAVTLADYQGVPVIASRGCPYECSFCDVAPAWGRRNERHSVSRVLDDLDVLHSGFGVSEVGFVDDLFVLNKKWVRDFCREKIRRDNPIQWHCTGHVNLVDNELAAAMAEAGCISVYLGAESGSNRILKAIQKNFLASDVVRAVEIVREQGIGVSANFLWGFPFEEVTDMVHTMSLMDRLNNLGARTSLMMVAPLASSPLYRRIPEEVVFNPDMPNVFLQDYQDLSSDRRPGFESLLAAHPLIFSAFYVFRAQNTLKLLTLRSFYRSIPNLDVGPEVKSSGAREDRIFIAQ